MANKPRSMTRPILPPLQIARLPGRNRVVTAPPNNPGGSFASPLSPETCQVLPTPVNSSPRNRARGRYDQAMIQRLGRRGLIPEYILSPSRGTGSSSSPILPQPGMPPLSTPATPQYSLHPPGLSGPESRQDPCEASGPGPQHTVNRTGCALLARLSQQDQARDPRELLRAWAGVFFGNTRNADAFVVARPLRRHSSSRPSEESHDSRAPPPVSPAVDVPGQLKLRALIRPQDPKKTCTLIRRVFNIDELQAMMPTTMPNTARVVLRPIKAHPLSTQRRQFGSVQSHESLSGRAVVNRDTQPDGVDLKRDPTATPIRRFPKSRRVY